MFYGDELRSWSVRGKDPTERLFRYTNGRSWLLDIARDRDSADTDECEFNLGHNPNSDSCSLRLLLSYTHEGFLHSCQKYSFDGSVENDHHLRDVLGARHGMCVFGAMALIYTEKRYTASV